MDNNILIKKYEAISYIILIFIPILLFFTSFMVGRYPINPVDVIKTILSPIIPNLTVSPTITSIVFNVRLPRIIAAIIVGASLSIAGASFQGLFKNPLVSPDLLGVSNGAGFGAAIAIILSFGNILTQASAFIFGIISVSITYLLSKSYKSAGTLVLVLSGVETA